MPKIEYEQIAPGVRRARQTETPEERAAQEARETLLNAIKAAKLLAAKAKGQPASKRDLAAEIDALVARAEALESLANYGR